MSDLNLENLADTYLRYCREERCADFWSFTEVNDLVRTNLDRAWEITSLLLSKAETGRELGYIASGPLEDFLGIYGDRALDRMEQGTNGGGRLQPAI